MRTAPASTPAPSADLDELATAVAEAARLVAPSWPIERFVAVNPLLGLTDLGFSGAVAEARRWLPVRGVPGAPVAVPAPATALGAADPALATGATELVARWCAALLGDHGDHGDHGEHGGPATSAFARWRSRAAHDRGLRRLGPRGLGATLAEVPEQAPDALLDALARLGAAAGAERDAELRGQLARVPGWAGYARWCDEWADPRDPAPRIGLVELLAISVWTDLLVGAPPRRPAVGGRSPGGGPGADPAVGAALEGLEAAEAAYRTGLIARLGRSRPPVAALPHPPAAQVVCCIDVRSEVLRRHLEALGPYETLGFAGFFAVPARIRPLGAAESYPSAPVLLQPDAEVAEQPAGAVGADLARARRHRATAQAAFEDLGHDPVAMYALAETAGWVLGPTALLRTLAPRPTRDPSADGTGTVLDPAQAFSLDERTALVAGALTTMGLTEGLAPVVVLCGHGSTSRANAHGASLDCGACGGNHGSPNARLLATMANDPDVRRALAGQGVAIGDDTWFVAAEHDTTLDAVTLLDLDAVPEGRRDAVEAVAADLAAAGERAARERLSRLPGGSGRGAGHARRRARRRAGDWAQTRPEWGLARNAAFVVGPRSMTAGVDLEGRAFLHSYDDRADEDGSSLATILTAPMVVAHWINAQYLCSTVDPDVYGAGDKALHNPVGSVGVVTGDGGDLRVGLPWQSVAGPDGPVHEPLRLLAVVQAPRERLERVIAQHEILGRLFDGAWVHLLARDDAAAGWSRRLPGGTWVPAGDPVDEASP